MAKAAGVHIHVQVQEQWSSRSAMYILPDAKRDKVTGKKKIKKICKRRKELRWKSKWGGHTERVHVYNIQQ